MSSRHGHAFDEVATLLQATLQDLGHTVSHVRNRTGTGRNIVLGCNLISPQALVGVDYIAYQLEQLFPGSPWWARVEPVIRGAAEVWDYSLANVAFLAHHGIKARYLPVGWHPSLKRIPRLPSVQQVLFYGALSPRRKEILSQVGQAGLTTLALSSVVFGSKRDSHIAQSRLNLNLHYYEANVFESVRVAYLLNNQRLVLSEASDSYPYTGVDLPMATAGRIPGVCLDLLNSEPERVGRLCGEQFAELYPMQGLVSEILR
jgi:hypothetical protein